MPKIKIYENALPIAASGSRVTSAPIPQRPARVMAAIRNAYLLDQGPRTWLSFQNVDHRHQKKR
jgi:hypothetical protein